MQNLLRQLRRNRKKPLIFGLFGAAGCLVTEISLSEVYSVSRKGEVYIKPGRSKDFSRKNLPHLSDKLCISIPQF